MVNKLEVSYMSLRNFKKDISLRELVNLVTLNIAALSKLVF